LGAYSNAAQYITALYNDPINPLFRQIASTADLLATLLAALLHDLGQYQHAHDLDDVESVVFKHETLTASLLKGDYVHFKALTESLRHRLRDEWHIEPERVLAILEANPEKLSTSIRDRLLHTIVSGPIDGGAPRFLDGVNRLFLWSSLGSEARQEAKGSLIPEG
jgi:HD superfamily phosphohydrolase